MAFKVDIKYKIGNRTVSQQEWERHIKQSAKEQAIAVTVNRIKAVRCPEHGLSPEVTQSGDNLNISGCCEKVIEAAKRAMSS